MELLHYSVGGGHNNCRNAGRLWSLCLVRRFIYIHSCVERQHAVSSVHDRLEHLVEGLVQEVDAILRYYQQCSGREFEELPFLKPSLLCDLANSGEAIDDLDVRRAIASRYFGHSVLDAATNRPW